MSIIENRIGKLRGELTEGNKEINILKSEASKQINQIRESITKFLDKEMGMFRTTLELWPKLGIVLIWAGPTRN